MNEIKLTPGIAEFVGALIGDGYVYSKNHHYVIGIVGNPINDFEYFEYLRNLIQREFVVNVKTKKRFRGLRMIFSSKRVVEFLCRDLSMNFGADKSENITIPSTIINDKILLKAAIRGIVDTDGSVFVSNKKGAPNYPSIEITTSSYALALQIQESLQTFGFNVANIWNYKSKLSKRTTYKVPLNGKKNLKKWIEEIGFSNNYKLKRAHDIVKMMG